MLDRIRLDEPRGLSLAALVAGFAANLDALAGRVPEAMAGYRVALRGLEDLGLRWEAALVGLDMAILLDPAEPAVQAAARAARATFEELRARPFVERLDAALASDTGHARSAPSTLPAERADPVRP